MTWDATLAMLAVEGMVVVEKQVTLGGREITSAGIPMSERGSRAGKLHVISTFGASRKLNLMDPQLVFVVYGISPPWKSLRRA